MLKKKSFKKTFKTFLFYLVLFYTINELNIPKAKTKINHILTKAKSIDLFFLYCSKLIVDELSYEKTIGTPITSKKENKIKDRIKNLKIKSIK